MPVCCCDHIAGKYRNQFLLVGVHFRSDRHSIYFIRGLWAVVVTDVLQFIILIAAGLILLPLSFEKVGGISSFIQKIELQNTSSFFALSDQNILSVFYLDFCSIIFLSGRTMEFYSKIY